jgi:hypothetical protein
VDDLKSKVTSAAWLAVAAMVRSAAADARSTFFSFKELSYRSFFLRG